MHTTRIPLINPLSPESAVEEIKKYYGSGLKKIFPLNKTVLKVIDLIRKYKITRQNIHDLHLLATMLDNNINGIYTRNEEHFTVFCKEENIQLINPF